MTSDMITHGHLPHWYKPGHAHFVTYRLAETIPVDVLQKWRLERDQQLYGPRPYGTSVEDHRRAIHARFFGNYDRHLDQRSDGDRKWLADPRVAIMIKDNLWHHNGTKYSRLAYCIIPKHVHVVLQPFETVCESIVVGDAGSVAHGQPSRHIENEREFPSDEFPDSRSPLAGIMHSLKSFTANRANEILGRRGQFWQRESYDHWVRDLEELERIVDYVIQNPVKAGLCAKPAEYPFSSAHERFAIDQSECGLIGSLRDDWHR